MAFNQATLIGNVGHSPKITHAEDGKQARATFSLATSEQWKDRETGEKKERTEWHNIVIFQEGLVKIVEAYVSKGSKLLIIGQIRTRKYTGNDGVEKSTTEIVLSGFNGQLKLLDSKPRNENEPTQQANTPFDAPEDLDDEIPF